MTEDYCFGQLDISLNADLTWAADIVDEVCWQRIMMNNGRTTANAPPHTAEDFEFQSTQPLVSAGGNLYEMYGEEVIASVGQGEERLATILSAPSDDNLLILGYYDRESDLGNTGYYHVLDQLVKSTPAIRGARTAADLENTTWRSALITRSASTTSANFEASTALLNTFDLLPGSVCTFSTSSVLAPDFDHNRDVATSLQFDSGLSFDDRGVSAGRNHQTVSDCTWEIDTDNYLALSFNLTGIDPVFGPVPSTIRYVVSDNNNYLVFAQEVAGVDSNPNALQTGFLSPTDMVASDLDGTFFFHLSVFEFEASGANHSMGGGDTQEFDVFGRGKVAFDSATAGTVPSGQAGNWFACDVQMILDEFGNSYSGSSLDSSVSVSTEQSAEFFPFTDCSYNTDADGGLRLWLNVSEPGDPDPEEVMFRGYVNDSFEVMSLFDWRTEPVHGNSAMAVDFASIRNILGMKYTGDPDGNEDGDDLTNFEEFRFPLPPPDPMFCSGGLVCGVEDINKNGSPDIAVLLVDIVSGDSIVYIRDGRTDALISTINFGAVTVESLQAITDISGNGIPELAAMANLSSGQVRVQIKDMLTGGTVNNVFYGDIYSGVDMAILPDTNGNGADELVVVGAAVSGAVRVQARDALTDDATSTTYYGNKAVPVSVAVVPDVSGGGAAEMVMHGIVNGSNQSRSQMRDSVTGVVVRNIFYGDFYVPMRVSTIGDLTGDGVPELAELAVAAGGAARVKVKNPATGAHVTNAFIGSDPPLAVVGIEDANSDGVRDIAVLVNNAGLARVSRWDGVTGDFIDNVFFATAGVPAALTLVGDIDDNDEMEFAVLGNDAGQDRVKVKNTVAGTGVNDIDFP